MTASAPLRLGQIGSNLRRRLLTASFTQAMWASEAPLAENMLSIELHSRSA
jgi:hypothetical protein